MKKMLLFALVIVTIFAMVACGSSTESETEPPAESETPEIETVAPNVEPSKAVEESTEPEPPESDEPEAEPESEEPETVVDEYAEINEKIAQWVAENKGWAMGTLDRNGNPDPNAEPLPEYADWFYVSSIVYDGNGVIVDVLADFQNFSEERKSSLISDCQGVARACIGGDYSFPFVEVRNGELAYGCSKALNVQEFKWYE